MTEEIKRQDAAICCPQETYLRPKDTCRLRAEKWKIIYHANGSEKEAKAAILLLDKIDSKTKIVTRHKEGHYREKLNKKI